jgi:CBS domain-containing protein
MGTLADIVKPDFLTVAPEDTLGEVADRMTRRNVGAVVVKDFGRLIGILTERDMLRAMAARVHTSDARVRQFMTADPVTVAPDTDLEDAAQIMLDNGFRHLPVVDGSTVVGIVSLRRVLGGRRRPAGEQDPEAASETAPAPEAA